MCVISRGFRTLAWIVTASTVLTAYAAVQQEDGDRDEPMSTFVQPPRELMMPLVRARRAIDQKDYNTAATLLTGILSDNQNEDYLIRLDDRQPVAVSLYAEAQRLLGSLPDSARQSIEDRYGIEAEQLLNQAVQRGDYEQISRVMRRYFHTKAGYLAAVLLGHHHLSEGAPPRPPVVFKRSSTVPRLGDFTTPKRPCCWPSPGCWRGTRTRRMQFCDKLASRIRIIRSIFRTATSPGLTTRPIRLTGWQNSWERVRCNPIG